MNGDKLHSRKQNLLKWAECTDTFIITLFISVISVIQLYTNRTHISN